MRLLRRCCVTPSTRSLEQRVSGSDTHEAGSARSTPRARPALRHRQARDVFEKEPEKDTRVVDPKVLQQIWWDFAPSSSS
jgi:hypothetical protein